MPPTYPLSFDPVLKQYPWGGRNLERLGRRLPPGIVAESWEISAHPNGATPVRSGPLAGRFLAELQRQLGPALVGRRSRDALERDRFPLMIKLLDANDWLSVQVHPDDRYALERHGDLGKTEMWVVLHAEPGAELMLGFRRPTDRDEVARAITAGRLEALLQRVATRAGDVFLVRPGTVHAIGPGLLLAEIQQSSDLTFRLFDWNRGAADRPLHLVEGLSVSDFGVAAAGPVAPRALVGRDARVEEIGRSAHFVTERLALDAGGSYQGLCDGETFEIWGVLDGRCTLGSDRHPPLDFAAVEWLLLPAELGRYEIEAISLSVLLRILIPETTAEPPPTSAAG